jgi:hypothetical protein
VIKLEQTHTTSDSDLNILELSIIIMLVEIGEYVSIFIFIIHSLNFITFRDNSESLRHNSS